MERRDMLAKQVLNLLRSASEPRALGRVHGIVFPIFFLAYRWPTNRPLCRFCRFLGV